MGVCRYRRGGICPQTPLTQPRTALWWLWGFWGGAEGPRRDFHSSSRFLAGAVGAQLPVTVSPGGGRLVTVAAPPVPEGHGELRQTRVALPPVALGLPGSGPPGQVVATASPASPRSRLELPATAGDGPAAGLLPWCPPPRCPRGGQGPGSRFLPLCLTPVPPSPPPNIPPWCRLGTRGARARGVCVCVWGGGLFSSSPPRARSR